MIRMTKYSLFTRKSALEQNSNAEQGTCQKGRNAILHNDKANSKYRPEINEKDGHKDDKGKNVLGRGESR